MNKIIRQIRFSFALFGEKAYLNTNTAMKPSSQLPSTPPLAVKQRYSHPRHPPTQWPNSAMEFEYWRNQSQFLPLCIWVSSWITVQETKLAKLQVHCSPWRIPTWRLRLTPVRLWTTASRRCRADSSKWTTTEKMRTIVPHAFPMMWLMSSLWSQTQHSNPRTSSLPV